MGRLLSLAVLLVAVAAGAFAGDAARAGSRHGEYTLAQAYYDGIITADDLAGFGCVPFGYGAITCAPTDLPWCPEHPPSNLGRFAGATLDGNLVELSGTEECQASPYDLGVIAGFHSSGPPRMPRPYLR